MFTRDYAPLHLAEVAILLFAAIAVLPVAIVVCVTASLFSAISVIVRRAISVFSNKQNTTVQRRSGVARCSINASRFTSWKAAMTYFYTYERKIDPDYSGVSAAFLDWLFSPVEWKTEKEECTDNPEIVLNRITGGARRFVLQIPTVTICAESRDDASQTVEEFLADHAEDYLEEKCNDHIK